MPADRARRVVLLALLTIGTSLAPVSRAVAQGTDTKALLASALAGESIPLLPLTLAAADPALTADSTFAPYRERRRTLAWADSIIGESFESRAPEVTWVLPAALRRLARRNPGMMPEPDHLGQAVLASPKLKRVPDPLRTSLRQVTAFSGGRFAMVPAALSFTRDTSGALRAELSLVLADTRNGSVAWRTLAWGLGATPPEALTAALALVLPAEIPPQ
ncbi:MAG TPA: hypothetical protein VFW66_14385 [Gemmatimonadales bacterium]|nr:hypothetical protein [Gemmatimonadales bacterium]